MHRTSTLRQVDLELFTAIRLIYERNAVGCCLHIVLDDLNVADQHVQHCIDFAFENEHPDCAAIGQTLLNDYTMLERWAIASLHGQPEAELIMDGFIEPEGTEDA